MNGTTRHLTLEQIAREHPELRASVLGGVQHCCQPSGTDAQGNVLFSENLVLLAARSLSGQDPANTHRGMPGVSYR